ncbi:MAG: DNA methyltransferase [Candidatus Binatus sp.]|uniref:DNA methyltransferase n=1 Tax=Candidatus Binatus sp. TaxID=2811406 RepID=UPI0027209653|nr:DNA methyltransferase [Candidatus Binatus sp.]MDO8432360.1 DNA methyltransferase [Candidatus Binatus sp.]
MAKPPKEAYEISDAEKRDLIQLIQQGKALPEKYRFILFADKREVELVWNGKNREVCTTVLPFQSLEHVDEPRQEKPELGTLDMFDTRGRQLKGWTNKLIWGDNKLILSSLKSGALRRQIEDAGGLKLIYIDPPFDVGADFSMDIEIGGETFHKEPNLLEQIAYRDTWGRGADSFISMIYERLILMRDLLAEDGTIYLHMAPNMAPFIELAMGEVFGRDRVLCSIVWQRATAHGNVGIRYATVTDRIIVATRSDRYIWNGPYQPYSKDYIESHYSSVEPGTGRRFTLRDVTAPMSRASESQKYEWRGVRPVGSRCWSFTEPRMNELFDAGKIVLTGGKMPRMKLYLDEMPGIPATDLWSDLSAVNSQAREDTQYPTQKPETVLERIIKASSNEGDLVADFFCGSGTTAAVAEKLGRKWIATDLGKFGIHTTRKRLIGVQRELKESGKPFRAFEVLNLGRYERQAYLNVGGRLTGKQKEQALAQKEREFRDLILRAYKAQPLEGESFFHGKNAGRLVVVGPINLPVGRLFVEEVITECRKRGASRVDMLAFEFEMGLFPAVLDEAKQKGIDLVPKQIPPEVFDKRAVEKGQVVFFDVSFIEATPRYHKKDKFTLQIELTDFSVYYTQGAAEAAAASLKNGKSEVVCEQGQLIKVSKDKDGVVTRDILTKNWTDWVDYWAVDFDYMSRKEIIKVAVEADAPSPPTPLPQAGEGGQRPGEGEFEERWTGSYIFENEWQSFRTRKDRDLEFISAPHTYTKAGRYTVAVKVIDIFGNDTMVLVPVSVG